MSVFLRPGSPAYSYDFRHGKQRYSGSTGTTDRTEALLFEAAVRDAAVGPSTLARAILKNAKRRVPNRKSATGYIYVIKSGYFVKVGHSNNPRERLETIATASPETCELIFCLRGSVTLERQLHREFAASHYRGEWFFYCGRLRRFIEEFRQSTTYDPLLSLPLVPHEP